jgi:hypothetical protein
VDTSLSAEDVAVSIERILLDEATRVANSVEDGVAAFEAELMAMEQRKMETEVELKTAKLARTRLLDFRPRLGHGFQCPTAGFKTKRNLRLRPSIARGVHPVLGMRDFFEHKLNECGGLGSRQADLLIGRLA